MGPQQLPHVRTPRPARSRLAAAFLAALSLAALASCGQPGDGAGGDGGSDGAAVPQEQRGEVLSFTPLTDLDAGVRDNAAASYRVLYRSVYGPDDSPSQVSGTVFLPKGDAPDGGWPVVSVGHGTTGVRPECGPSGYPDLLGHAQYVSALLKAGYVVALSDYQGLGQADPERLHPYLEPETAAYNVIDAVRAARNVLAQQNDAEVSDRWAAVGRSQGGHAVWAAAELAEEYAPDLRFVGAAAVAPAADLTPIGATEPPWQLHPLQLGLLPYVLEGLRAVRPQTSLGDYVSGNFAAGFDTLTSCTGAELIDKISVILSSNPGEIGPFTPEATAGIRDWFAEAALPRRAPDGPLLVVYGGADPIIKPEWTAGAVAEACALGAVVQAQERAGADHFNLAATDEVVRWVGARFAGEAAPDTCG